MDEEFFASEERQSLIDSLSVEQKRAIENLVESLGLSDYEIQELMACVGELKGLKEGRFLSKTDAEVVAELMRVSKAAEEFCSAIDSLGTGYIDVIHAFDDVFSKAEISDTSLIELRKFLPNVTALVSMVQLGSVRLELKLRNDGVSGRRRTLGTYASLVEEIFHVLENHGVTLGRGGFFERFCDEIFSIAGVPAKAEGSIKYLLARGLDRRLVDGEWIIRDLPLGRYFR